MRTFKIEMRVDFKDESKYDAVAEVIRELARGAFTTAKLLEDSRPTKIVLESGDLFMGTEEIALFAEEQEALEASRGE